MASWDLGAEEAVGLPTTVGVMTTSEEIFAQKSDDATRVELTTSGESRCCDTMWKDEKVSGDVHGSSEDEIQHWKNTTHQCDEKFGIERDDTRSCADVAKSGMEAPKSVPHAAWPRRKKAK